MKSVCKIILPILFSFLLLTSANGQAVGTWKTYTAYQKATQVAVADKLVFAVYESLRDDADSKQDGSLLSYDPEYDEITTYSIQDGLSDVGIKLIHYSKANKALVIAYNNSNIDIFFGKHDVVNFSNIKNSNKYQDKGIYNIEEYGDYVYLSTGFGIVALDLKDKVIKDEYHLDLAVRSVCQKDDYLYAASSSGVIKGLLSSNLKDIENWTLADKEEIDYPWDGQFFRKIVYFKDTWVIQDNWSTTYFANGEFKWLIGGTIRDMQIINDQLVVCTDDKTVFYSDFDKPISVERTSYSIRQGQEADTYWIAGGNEGLISAKRTSDSDQMEVLTDDLIVNSPLRNLVFDMKFQGNKLAVVGGGRKADRFNNPGTLMVLEDGKWYNFDNKKIAEQTGLRCDDFMSIAIDPKDPNHYFVSSWGEGVYEFKDNEFVELYSWRNSTLSPTILSNKDNFVRVSGIGFDKDGSNLYMISDEIENALSVRSAQGTWKSYGFEAVDKNTLDKLLVANSGLWITYRKSGRLTVIDKDWKCHSSQLFYDQQGINIEASSYYALAEDANRQIWVGTNNGPIYFSSAANVSAGRCSRIIATDQDGINYRLLEGVAISAIAVDGGNRKWMGTSGNGVYLVDNTGSELQVENFNTTNSPLTSDNIQAIAINDRTGEVYIGTDNGLFSYQSDAIEGSADYSNTYAYPNPVYPEKQGTPRVIITGLMNNSAVKITDMAGNLIREGTSIGGQYSWNCTGLDGEIVRAGIYLVFAGQEDGSVGVATKIMVVK
ncbi:hypothetical protein LJB84_00500 [Bacteroidales bacterium OttesenSCG-928-J19]|nr:hypothetical protein [Bacteroidales bacterium OttesenSCG-928-J19]